MIESENAYKAAGMTWMETYQGHHFSIIEDNPPFDVLDIAHGLSLACRWGGQCARFYSVAEHSIMVSRIMELEEFGDPMVGLWHDGTEAYMSDVPSPFKQLLPDWSAIDHVLEEKMFEWLKLPFPKGEGCKKADWLALYIEAFDLMGSGGKDFLDPLGLKLLAHELYDEGIKVRCWTPDIAEMKFLERYAQLQKQTGTD